MAKLGVVTKPTHDNIIRFAPPLTIVDKEMAEATDIIS